MCRTLKELRLRSDQTDVVFGCSHISQPVLSHLACCPGLRRLGISSAELMSVDLGALRHLVLLEVLTHMCSTGWCTDTACNPCLSQFRHDLTCHPCDHLRKYYGSSKLLCS